MKIGTAVLFRTHFWSEAVAQAWARLQVRTKLPCWVCADETRGVLVTPEGAPKLPHTVDDFRAMRLWCQPAAKVLWHNGDYPLYRVLEQIPNSHVLMLEYDTYVGADLDPWVQRWMSEGLDFVAPRFKLRGKDWHWHKSTRRTYELAAERGGSLPGGIPDIYGILFPFIFISRRALQYLLERRLLLTRAFQGKQPIVWPFCEAFVPTELMAAGFRCASLGDYMDTSRVSFLEPIHVHEASGMGPIVAHPVLEGQDYVRKLLAYKGIRSIQQFDTQRPELAAALSFETDAVIALALSSLPASNSSVARQLP